MILFVLIRFWAHYAVILLSWNVDKYEWKLRDKEYMGLCPYVYMILTS